MKQKFLKIVAICTLATACLSAFAACEKGSDESISSVSGDSKQTAVEISEISLDKAELTLEVGQKSVLTATLSPDNATGITWSSDAETVVTVENGTVKAVAEGIATITASAGDKSATCTITVLPIKMTEEEWKQVLTDSFAARNVTLYTNSYELTSNSGKEMFVFCYFDWENNILAVLTDSESTEMDYFVFDGDTTYSCYYYGNDWEVYISDQTKEECGNEWMEVIYEEVIGISDIQALWQAYQYDTCEFDQATNTYTVSLVSYKEICTYKVAFRNGKVYEITEVGESDSYTTRFVDYGTTVAVIPEDLKVAIEEYEPEEE